MDSRIVPELIGLGVLILISALLSGAEAAYFSLGRTRLSELAEQRGRRRGRSPRCWPSRTTCW